MCTILKKALILLVGSVSIYTCDAFQTSSSPLFGKSPTTRSTSTPIIQSTFQLEAIPGKDWSADESLSFESAVRKGWKPERGQFAGIRRAGKMGNTAMEMSDDGAIMPDGGLSPCIIKVVGVGGGGCNAVSTYCSHLA